MKRRPKLMKKLSATKQSGFREVIGLIGIRRGAGVTYTGLMLAFYMAEELGMKTAYLECNKHDDFKLIQWAYDWMKEEGKSFSFYQLTCYREVKPEQLAEIEREGYECIIMDFGSDLAGNKADLLRCSKKLIIGGGSDWDLWKLSQFAEDSDTIRGKEDWLYLIPQAEESTITKIRREIRRNTRSVPAETDPTCLKRTTRLFFKELLRY